MGLATNPVGRDQGELPPGSGRRLSAPGLLLIAAMVSGAYAWCLIAVPVATLENVAKHRGHFRAVYAHMIGGTIMLALGAANLYVGTTRRFFRYHRALGRTYLLGGSIGALLALALALGNGHRNPPDPLSFRLADVSDTGIALASLAIAWLAASVMAFRAARNRRFDAHRAWMIRSYVLTWSFVLCRLVGRVPTLAELGDGAAIVWLSWIVPLFACEIGLQWSGGAARPVRQT